MMSPKQRTVPEPLKPGTGSMMETMKAKAHVLLMPTCLIIIVYFVDNVLFWISSSGKSASEGATSTSSSNYVFEFASIVLCVLAPAIYFGSKHRKDKSETKIPNASD